MVGAGTLKDAPGREIKDAPGRETGGREESTRLALSPPVVVAVGATVGLFVHSAKRDSNGVQLSKRGNLRASPGEEVDASDSAISMLKGGWCFEKKPFVSVRTDGCYALAGSVEYEMARCEPSDSTAVCGEVMRALCEGPEGEPRWAADVRKLGRLCSHRAQDRARVLVMNLWWLCVGLSSGTRAQAAARARSVSE